VIDRALSAETEQNFRKNPSVRWFPRTSCTCGGGIYEIARDFDCREPEIQELGLPAVELFLRLSARKDKRHHTGSHNKHAADARDRYGLLPLCRNVD